jgi:aminoglycoside phosphotransferase (APT) family kinase protein
MRADIERDQLRAWLAGNVPSLGELVAVEKFAGGQSNPTYRVAGRNGDCVLRRKPFGALLPSAHAIEREYRVLRALHPTGFPVPEPLAQCEDPQIIGASFYVMGMVAGRNYEDSLLKEADPAERRAIYTSTIQTLARLHSVDVDAAGLRDFGREGNFFARQVARWTTQYRATQTEYIAEVEKLIDWLPRSLPSQLRTTIIHGDYRIDNLIFDGSSSVVHAVLDWELATLGDPLSDFTYLLMNWVMPPMGPFGIDTVDASKSGIPSMNEAIDIYRTASGAEEIANPHWYFSYNLFRLTGITQGIKKRVLDGNASSEKANEAASRVPIFARLAWEQAERAGA